LGRRLDRRLHRWKIVGRILSCEVRIVRIRENAFITGSECDDTRAHFASVGAVDDQRSNGIRAEIEAEGELAHR